MAHSSRRPRASSSGWGGRRAAGRRAGVVAVTPVPQEPPAALRDTQRTASVRRLSTNSCASERVLVETVFSTRLR